MMSLYKIDIFYPLFTINTIYIGMQNAISIVHVNADNIHSMEN